MSNIPIKNVFFDIPVYNIYHPHQIPLYSFISIKSTWTFQWINDGALRVPWNRSSQRFRSSQKMHEMLMQRLSTVHDKVADRGLLRAPKWAINVVNPTINHTNVPHLIVLLWYFVLFCDVIYICSINRIWQGLPHWPLWRFAAGHWDARSKMPNQLMCRAKLSCTASAQGFLLACEGTCPYC